MRLPNPKKLSLENQWELYKILESSLKDISMSSPLLDIISKIFETISYPELLHVLELLYINFNLDEKNEVQLLTMLTRGLKQNDFFSFVTFMRVLNERR